MTASSDTSVTCTWQCFCGEDLTIDSLGPARMSLSVLFGVYAYDFPEYLVCPTVSAPQDSRDMFSCTNEILHVCAVVKVPNASSCICESVHVN
jgi:hypothetical protein